MRSLRPDRSRRAVLALVAGALTAAALPVMASPASAQTFQPPPNDVPPAPACAAITAQNPPATRGYPIPTLNFIVGGTLTDGATKVTGINATLCSVFQVPQYPDLVLPSNLFPSLPPVNPSVPQTGAVFSTAQVAYGLADITLNLPTTLPIPPVTVPTLPVTLPSLPVTLPSLPVTTPSLAVSLPGAGSQSTATSSTTGSGTATPSTTVSGTATPSSTSSSSTSSTSTSSTSTSSTSTSSSSTVSGPAVSGTPVTIPTVTVPGSGTLPSLSTLLSLLKEFLPGVAQPNAGQLSFTPVPLSEVGSGCANEEADANTCAPIEQAVAQLPAAERGGFNLDIVTAVQNTIYIPSKKDPLLTCTLDPTVVPFSTNPAELASGAPGVPITGPLTDASATVVSTPQFKSLPPVQSCNIPLLAPVISLVLQSGTPTFVAPLSLNLSLTNGPG